MNFKIGNMKTKNIVNSIFFVGLIYFLILIIDLIFTILMKPGMNSTNIIVRVNAYMYLIIDTSTLIAGVIFLKLLCEIIYKILKLIDIFLENQK